MSTATLARLRWSNRSTTDLALTASRAALGALLVVALAARVAGVSVSMRAQLLVYLVAMVGLNLPHGGYEHFANLRRRAAAFRLWYVGGYLLAVGAFVALFAVSPVAGLALALGVACAKGGGGDLALMEATTGTGHLRTRAQRLLAAVTRGGAVMAVPVVAFPNTFYTFSAIMTGLFEPEALAAAGVPFETTRLLVAVGYGSLVLAHLALGVARRDGSGSVRTDAVETLLLVAYFAVVPVVVAVGLYFPLWYSVRQVARELAVDADPVGDGPDLLDAGSVGAVALRAWVVLVGGAIATGVVAAVVWAVVPNPLGGAPLLYGAVAFWSVFISIVALPHVVVGAVLDRRRGIWHVP